MTRRTLHTTVDQAPFREPFRIAGHVIHGLPALRVTLTEEGVAGRGEAGGVFYLGDDVDHMLGEVERVRREVVAGIDRAALRDLLPPGGARNAIDAALWELEARRTGRAVWQIAGLARPQGRVTTYTLGADDPGTILRNLAGYADARALKLKLDGDVDADILRLRCVREARPETWLMVDANQGYTPEGLMQLVPTLVAYDVQLLEQPLARGSEAALEGLSLPLAIAADESALGLADLAGLVGRFQVVNIKLDKCGGLTEALMMVAEARRLSLRVMVGNMGGTSLAAAPAFLLAQICDVVDLDGPKFLASDMPGGARYADGRIMIDEGFWG